MSMAMLVGWLLDLNSTTDEVVAVLKRHDFNIGGATFDGGTVSALHWGITDASGKSAIPEFDHGEVRIYDEGDLSAVTNDPNWPQMQAIISYWDKIGGKNMLPGTVSSPDRCVRGHYFVNHVEKTGDRNLGVSILRSVMGICSVPYTYTVDGEPNISSTQWRSYANLRDLVYYFDIVTNEGIFYVDLKKCNLRKGSPVLKLDTSKSGGYVGDATGRLKKDKRLHADVLGDRHRLGRAISGMRVRQTVIRAVRTEKHTLRTGFLSALFLLSCRQDSPPG